MNAALVNCAPWSLLKISGLPWVRKACSRQSTQKTASMLLLEKIGTDTIIVTIRGVCGHDRACHELPEPLHSATRIM